MLILKDIKKQFFNSVKRGTGEAYILLKQYPEIDFSAAILKGAIHNYALDQQCEGSRAAYIYQLIMKSKQKERIIKKVSQRLRTETSDDCGIIQMCDLAVLLFNDGYTDMKDIMYEKVENSTCDYGYSQLIAIDGLSGLLKVAEQVGKILTQNNSWDEDSLLADTFQKANKTIDVYAELEKAGCDNAYIQVYYQAIIQNKWKPYKRRKRVYDYAYIKGAIDDKKRFVYIPKDAVDKISTEDVERLATDFLSEKEMKKQELYLSFFEKRQFPFDYKPLLEIASKRKYKNGRLIENALATLKFFKADEIRQFALKQLRVKKDSSEYLYLLISNYELGDGDLLCEIANQSDNYNFIHSIAYAFIEIYKNNKTKECKEPLELIYNKMNCGIHRTDIIEILEDNDVLSPQIREELRYDSFDEVRKLYKKTKK